MKPCRLPRFLAPLLLGCSLVAAQAAPVLNGFDLAGASVPVQAIEKGGPPRDGIPAIDQPRFVSAERAALAADDHVLGIERDGVARAYPVRILNWHEVVNDRFGTQPVVVTYCPLCGTGMAFEPPPATRGMAGAGRAGFGVSGLLYNSDVLLYDRATQSLWSQIMGRAVAGPLKGTALVDVPLTHTSWADWRRRHPATEVLSTATGHTRDYSRDPYAGYDRVPRLMFDVQHRDARLPLKAWVLGVRVGDSAMAYPLATLDQILRGSGELRDTVGGQALRIRYDRQHATAEVRDAQGQLLPGTLVFWFAWVAFHPKTDVLQAPK